MTQAAALQRHGHASQRRVHQQQRGEAAGGVCDGQRLLHQQGVFWIHPHPTGHWPAALWFWRLLHAAARHGLVLAHAHLWIPHVPPGLCAELRAGRAVMAVRLCFQLTSTRHSPCSMLGNAAAHSWSRHRARQQRQHLRCATPSAQTFRSRSVRTALASGEPMLKN